MSDEPILEVEDLSHQYRSRGLLRPGPASTLAVDAVSFAVKRGETFGIVGESGSGKTTMARIVSGLCRHTKGTVRFEGREIYGTSGDARWLYEKVQIVLQDPYSSLNPRARIARILERPLLVRSVARESRRERVAELLDLVGLEADIASRYPAQLSGGQRQRVAIARALAAEPGLLVLDEPTSALDVSTQAQIVNLLRELQRGLGLTYVFVSHNLALVAYLCDRMLVMQHGRAVETGAALRVYREPEHEYTKELMSAVVTPRSPRRSDPQAG